MNQKMGLIGRKIGMTQLFEDDGTVLPVTVVQTGPCTVIQVKTTETRDGYTAVQLGYGERKASRTTKAAMGHAKKAGLDKAPKVLREFRLPDGQANYEVGQSLGASDVFTEGGKVDVTGISKGRGFSGVMRRYSFRGFLRSHGTHEFFRHGGSIGTRLTPGHVLKGKKMPGHMGAERVTVQNLQVVKVDADRNLVFLKGGVPGPTGATVVVRQAAKA